MEEEQSGIVALSSPSAQHLNLETQFKNFVDTQRELIEILTSTNDDSAQISSSESEKLLKDCLLDLERKVKEITSASLDLDSENLDNYLKDAKEELKLVASANSTMYDEIEVLTRTCIEDSTRLESDLEGLSCSLKFIESQGLDKFEVAAHVECSTALEGQERLLNAIQGYNFEVLDVDDKIDESKVALSYLKDLHDIVTRVEAVGQIEDILTGLKVIEFEGNCIRLSLKTLVPTSDGLFHQQELESASDLLALEHELLIELSDGTLELKNLKIFPDDIVIDDIIDAVKSSRKPIPSLQSAETRSPLEWLVREVQNRIVLSTQKGLQMKDANTSK